MKETKGSTVLKKEKRNMGPLLKKHEENSRNKFIEIVDEIVIQECFDIISGLLDISND